MTAPPDGPVHEVSVLMPVHAGVDAAHLAAALESVRAQTVPVREVVVVLDGPVGAAHHAVLDRFPALVVVPLPEAGGAGRALRAGLERCRATWVARADSDDLNHADRLAVQLDRLRLSGADVCSGGMTEFLGDPSRPIGYRGSVTRPEEFARLLPTRNPVHHPTVVIRRAAALEAGGYCDLPYLEDYDLWARMMAAGCTFVGVDRAVVDFRSDGSSGRRRQWRAVRSELGLQRRLHHYGLVGWGRAAVNLVVRIGYLRSPRWLQARAYDRLLRSSAQS